MSLNYGPQVVTDGLTCYIDPYNITCYPESGNILYDLSGNNNHATKTSNITISNGWMDWGSSNNAEYVSIPKEALHGLSYWTVEFSLYITSITSGINTFISCGDANNMLWYFGDHTVLYSQNPTGGGWSYSTTPNIPFVFTATGAPTKDLSTYKNGSFVQNITTGSESYISVDGTHSEITLGQEYDADTSGGFDPSQSWLGKMGIVKFYNRVLTDEEILQNYYSHKTRFGI